MSDTRKLSELTLPIGDDFLWEILEFQPSPIGIPPVEIFGDYPDEKSFVEWHIPAQIRY